MAAQNKGWTSEQWTQQLRVTQDAARIAINHLKGHLEYCLRVGNGPWKQIYDCLGTIDHMEEVINTASWNRGWKTNPVVLMQQLLRQIRNFQIVELDPYRMALSMVLNNITGLWEHSVS
jgi:hypothetical protein